MGLISTFGCCLRCNGLQKSFQQSKLRLLLLNPSTSNCTMGSAGAFRFFGTRVSQHVLAQSASKSKQLLLPSKLRLMVRTEFRRNASEKRLPKQYKDVKWKDVKDIFKLAWPYRKRIFAGLCFLGTSSVLYLSLPRILGKLIDELDESKPRIPEEEQDFLGRMAHFFRRNPYALGAILFIGAAAIAARIYLMHTASQLIVNDLRTTVFRSILHQDMAFFDKNKVGEIISRLSSDAYVVGYSVSSNLSEGVRAIVTFSGTIGMMVYTSSQLSAMGTVIIPVFVGLLLWAGTIQRKYTLQMQEAVAGTNQLATERLSNVRTVRVFVAEKKELQAYKDRINDIWKVSKGEGSAKGLFVGCFQLTGYAFLTSLLYYGGNLISQGLLTYGELSAFMIYAILCTASGHNLQAVYTEFMRGLGASARLFELRDMKATIPTTGGIVLNDLKKEIRFESVAFGYPERPPIFNDVTFRIPIASTTAIVGKSGCGKSTIAHLLLRLYTPTMGRIVIDDHDLRELDPSAWRKIIGTVSQEPALFSATIKENILYGIEQGREVSDDELHEAAELSNCLEFIHAFPNGFDTMVGEHGASMLSGGQRQRIAIARALIKKPRILILDEATSALDATGEYKVRKALDTLLAKSGHTVLIIAHRLSTIKHANQIVVLDKGTVAELGTFDSLMSTQDGIFRELVDKQTFHWRDDKY